MSLAITWRVQALDVRPVADSETNVVVAVHWECVGEEVADDTVYTGRVYNVCELPPPGMPFTPYDELTEAQVLGWIWSNGVNKLGVQALVTQQVANAKNPPIVTPPLPWADV